MSSQKQGNTFYNQNRWITLGEVFIQLIQTPVIVERVGVGSCDDTSPINSFTQEARIVDCATVFWGLEMLGYSVRTVFFVNQKMMFNFRHITSGRRYILVGFQRRHV